MTVDELRIRLIADGFPEHMYSLLNGGFPNEAFCLIESGKKWEVYYSEKGKKRGQRSFDSEGEACEYFYAKMKRYRK